MFSVLLASQCEDTRERYDTGLLARPLIVPHPIMKPV